MEVEDLAIVADHIAARGREHGLRPRRGEIDDRQPTVAERQPRLWVDPGPLCIGSAMPDRQRHRFGGFPQEVRAGSGPATQETGYSAHGALVLRTAIFARPLIRQQPSGRQLSLLLATSRAKVPPAESAGTETGRAACRDRGCQNE